MRIFWWIFVCALISGCQEESSKPVRNKKVAFLEGLHGSYPSCFSVEHLKGLIERSELHQASDYVNKALNVSVECMALHLWNGIIYQAMEEFHEKKSNSGLAEVAYRSAHTIDPTHWLPLYFLGSYQIRLKKYEEAKSNLAKALVLQPQNFDILYSLAFAGYYSTDLKIASFAIDRALNVRKNDPKALSAATIIAAASNQIKKAREHLQSYKNLVGAEHPTALSLAQRLDDFERLYANNKVEKKIQKCGQDRKRDLQYEEARNKPPTVEIDGYLLTLVHSNTLEKGNNFMQPLDEQGVAQVFGVTLGGQVFNHQRVRNRTTSSWKRPVPVTAGNTSKDSPGREGWTTSSDLSLKFFQNALSKEAVAYSLNLMNADVRKIEVMARPSLSVMVGQTGSFSNAERIVGSSETTIVIDVGTKLECRPLSIGRDGRVRLEVIMTSSALDRPVDKNKAIKEQIVVAQKSKASTTLDVYPGQTAVVAALQNDTRISNDSGIPILRNIPLLQYFASRVSNVSEKHTVLFMITLRVVGVPIDVSAIRKNEDTVQYLSSKGFPMQGQMYSNRYYVLKHLERSPMFAVFRSGDLIPPFYGYGPCASLKGMMDMVSSFCYF